ncbi:MAG: hypothetical protein AAFP28_05900 [Pseudomonadota bacterium]
MRWAAVFAALCLCGPLAAQDATLRFADGSFEVTGPILGFDGDAYRIETRFGVLTIAAGAVICEGECPTRDDAPLLRLDGSPIMTEVLVPALVDAFARSLGLGSRPVAAEGGVGLQLVTPDDQMVAQFNIVSSSTTTGFQRLAAGGADIVFADRWMNAEERATLRELGLGDLSNPLRKRLIARQAMQLYAAAEAPITSVSPKDLVDMTSRVLGAEGARLVVPAVEAEAFGDRLRVLQLRAAPGGIGAQSVEVAQTLDQALEAAQATEGRILMTAQDAGADGMRRVPLSHGCDSGSADKASGDAYPLMIHLWAYTAEPRLPELGRAFLAFAAGPEAQRVIDRAGFIDQRPRPIPLDAQGERIARAVAKLSEELTLPDLQRAITRLQGYDRLSTVFRFAADGVSLTRGSASEAQSLAALLDSGRYDGRELLFLGMTDSLGNAAENQADGGVQAQTVLDVVRRAMVTRSDRLPMTPIGLGELFPLACDKTAWGQFVNTRVEVWLGPKP